MPNVIAKMPNLLALVEVVDLADVGASIAWERSSWEICSFTSKVCVMTRPLGNRWRHDRLQRRTSRGRPGKGSPTCALWHVPRTEAASRNTNRLEGGPCP